MIWNTATTLAVALTLLTGTDATAQGEAPQAQPAEQQAPAAETPPDAPLWLISCSNQANPDQLLCEFSQSLIVSEGNQRLATASFTRVAGQDATEAVLTVPFGVSLSEGVSVSVDDNDVGTLQYDSCDGQGCYASGPVDDAWLQTMRAGDQLTASVRGRDGRDIALSFQLRGFSKADDMLP
ncbi:invasion associated locus B family protein [Paracoccus sp. R12_1]|uniref:invasion associated locus B family protein n=1 Tax=unclassified Paracoccus (in: a-proteobacteria) TaxID=2688777 RepID=UPI001ADAF8D8|nr:MULTISPECIES: invasion associated locus B family protein [unclassified Paracoccus (in: a-proteobacteria)]MBO9453894.1 invasion associated locus B family protein [Paracoccus sp. R12_2]MBO9485758.1 invasion associated locus B family protein [Paracoccus sp. R12_1]